jgi:hypothetical protein
MRLASPMLTSMPGMRVLDAHLYIGCHHLAALKVHHQLNLAGIEGARLLADPENTDLPCGYPRASEVADCWGCPRYLTRRGSLHVQQCHYSWIPPIPAPPLPLRCVSNGHRFSPCDDLSPRYDRSLLADDNERRTPRLRKRTCLNSHPGRVTRVHPCVSMRLHLIPTPTRYASRKPSSREMSGVVVLGSRRVVPTGRLAIQGVVRRVYTGRVSPWIWWSPSTGGT